MSLLTQWFSDAKINKLRVWFHEDGLDETSLRTDGNGGAYGANILDRAAMRGERQEVEELLRLATED